MALVDYSDSDASDLDEKKVAKPKAQPSKPAFQKVVDRSNPGKIKVSLSQAALKGDDKGDEPPTKRPKIGGGGFSGFSSFLPAPKRPAQSGNATLAGGDAVKRGGFGAGISLKTGAAPGFSREPASEQDYTYDTEEKNDAEPPTDGGAGAPLPKAVQDGEQKPAEEVKLVGKPLMFKPLSVARKPVKKKQVVAGSVSAAPSALSPVAPATPHAAAQKAERPRISLFSTGIESSLPAPASSTEYKPLFYQQQAGEIEGDTDSYGEPSYEGYTPTTAHSIPPAAPTPPVSQSLDDIAGDLNLSAAERRQLFGRQKGRNSGAPAATRVINFNTDQEYLHNEELRAAGEQVTHNPVRALASGKHSLKQLVNAAVSQKDALEESFAKGKSNRAEASSRYGW